MNKTYFETISLIEGIYLENEKILLQRDWSKYFDFEIKIDDGNNINIVKNGIINYLFKNINSKLEEKKITDLKKYYNNIFIEGLVKILNNHNFFYDGLNRKIIFSLDDTNKYKNLNEREYTFKKNKDKFIKSRSEYIGLVKSYLFTFKYGLDKNLKLDLNIRGINIEIKRKFNFKSFFLQNEAIFDINNDFYHTQISNDKENKLKKIIGKLKDTDENGKKIHLQTIENRIKTGEIKEGHIFRVDVRFDENLLTELNLQDKDLNQNKKEYKFLFFERNDYLVFDVKK